MIKYETMIVENNTFNADKPLAIWTEIWDTAEEADEYVNEVVHMTDSYNDQMEHTALFLTVFVLIHEDIENAPEPWGDVSRVEIQEYAP